MLNLCSSKTPSICYYRNRAAIAKAAIIGERSITKNDYGNPAATGIPRVLFSISSFKKHPGGIKNNRNR
jgi:hypothetical protein